MRLLLRKRRKARTYGKPPLKNINALATLTA